jgi:hypothetical protein
MSRDIGEEALAGVDGLVTQGRSAAAQSPNALSV